MKIYLHGMEDPVEISAKPDECTYYSCHESKPMYPIVWKCPNGHRRTHRYCGEHIQEMTELAFAPPQSGLTSGPVCMVCWPPVQMRPVMEGV